MKRWISITLILSLIFGIFPQIHGNAEKNLEKNLEEITNNMKNLFSITHDYESFDSRVNTYDGTVRYYLNWQDSSKEIPDIRIEVDEKENIISFNKNYKRQDKDEFKNISKDEANDIALEFIRKISPEKIKNISQIEDKINKNSPWDDFYNIQFYRQIEEIPYYDNTIYVNIDKKTKEVVNYNTNWDYDIEFPNKEKAIEKEKAKEILKEKIGLELIYKTKYNDDSKEPQFYLSYDFLNKNRVVDAISGDIIKINPYRPIGGMGEMEDTAKEQNLTPKEREEIEKLSGIKDIKEIEKSAREILKLEDDYKLVYSNLYSSWKNKDEYLWTLDFELDGEDPKGVNITLNAKNEELISFYKFQDDKDKKIIINREEALKIAKDYIKEIAPEKMEKLEYIPGDFRDEEKRFNFQFIRKEDDIYIQDDRVDIGVDATDKTIFSYSMNWYNGEMPPKGQIISKEKAYEVLFNQLDYELMYVKMYDRENLEMPRPNRGNFKIKLVYDTPPNKPVNIDAKDGKLLNNSGDAYITEKEIKYKDIKNSYAKEKIETLAEYNIGFRGEEFKPKEEIIQEDFLYLLWQSLYPYRNKEANSDEIYKDLINRGILKEEEKRPKSNLSKEDAVVFVIRAMGYEDIAKMEDIYKRDIFVDGDDIESKYIGHINLAYGFKIIQGNGENPPKLNPKKKLTREDASNIIYNYIFR